MMVWVPRSLRREPQQVHHMTQVPKTEEAVASPASALAKEGLGGLILKGKKGALGFLPQGNKPPFKS